MKLQGKHILNSSIEGQKEESCMPGAGVARMKPPARSLANIKSKDTFLLTVSSFLDK